MNALLLTLSSLWCLNVIGIGPSWPTREETLNAIPIPGNDNETIVLPAGYFPQPDPHYLSQRIRVTAGAEKLLQLSEERSYDLATWGLPLPADSGRVNEALQPVFDAYFNLKDALIRSDAKEAGEKGQVLADALAKVNMAQLEVNEHMVWMQSEASLKKDAQRIASAKDIGKQRAAFASLSAEMYTLMKASGTGTVTYYQYCPMYNGGEGAYWLSKENGIKNPYYGSSMLTCGKTIETIR